VRQTNWRAIFPGRISALHGVFPRAGTNHQDGSAGNSSHYAPRARAGMGHARMHTKTIGPLQPKPTRFFRGFALALKHFQGQAEFNGRRGGGGVGLHLSNLAHWRGGGTVAFGDRENAV
jgi:hypothetical protein